MSVRDEAKPMPAFISAEAGRNSHVDAACIGKDYRVGLWQALEEFGAGNVPVARREGPAKRVPEVSAFRKQLPALLDSLEQLQLRNLLSFGEIGRYDEGEDRSRPGELLIRRQLFRRGGTLTFEAERLERLVDDLVKGSA